MSIHNFKKALGLLIVDIVIIIGIFVLQFRTDSSIIEKLGQLTITMEKQETEGSALILNNKLQISYNGLSFFCDDQNPLKIESSEISAKEIKLLGYEKRDDFTYVLRFSQGVRLEVSVTSLESDATLAIHANLPATISAIYLPYNYSYNMKIKKSDNSSIIFDSKKNSWELQGFSLADGYATFTQANTMVAYSSYKDIQKFTFDSIVDLPIANGALFDSNIAAIKNNLITAFSATSEANISEQTVVSYIAAMAEQGNYVKAIDTVPQSFKHGKDRTYLSTPYLNTLSDMDDILQKTIKSNEAKISESAASGSFDIFGIRNLAAFLCIHPKANEVVAILTNASLANVEACSLSQIIGILQVYEELYDLNRDYANILTPILDDCIEKITSLTSLNGSILTISENDTFLSVVQSVETGIAVLRYGLISENSVLVNAGYAIVNSYISESSSFDIRTLSNLYPIIAYNNTYYPHFKKIEINKYNNIWAWTCARDITMPTHTNDDIVLNIDFPEGYTHYVIVKGIPNFHTIYIYNMAFRTDPRFETYNSSGYVYKKETRSLLLKSRHKTTVEQIHLEIGEEPAPAPKPQPAPEVKEEPAEDSEPSEETAEVTETTQVTE